MSEIKRKILLVGGGTLGSVSPLLAVAQKYSADYLFLGTKTGPEKNLIQSAGLNFQEISSGKLRRYWAWSNFVDLFKIKFAFWQSIKILKKFKPELVLTAGSFVAVPVAWGAWFLRIPVIVHQQDLEIGLANRLMAPVAQKITVTFEEQKKYFKQKKVVVTGNPVRQFLTSEKNQRPSILITGGGLGARGFNDFLRKFIPKLSKNFQVHHILGEKNYDQALSLENYHPYRSLNSGMGQLLNQAEIIISRAGMSLITEAAYFRKALILIPIPNTHQEKNAKFFAKHNAAYYCRQGSNQILERYLNKLTTNKVLRDGLADNLFKLFPTKAVDNYIKVIEDVL
ncbi:UDP-N-acetylglucosamine--N-acetylmuramyl-(pentapeptide) pyrophosphoryl-undecaprenol N-acetylglucosamine transferase [Candidatus Nomurabacteria bacterium]|nr:UDP-N-acetylglucosamine--N-acetylmuramyl-(pentapeptide) pyrophosphoryl-undecaprenol N-acetylglucosamine transferase [Candidatus Nomurabacteria bacterium]